jgi:thymidylate synthase (FAD)
VTRVYFEPKVILLARPSLVVEGIRELLTAEYGHDDSRMTQTIHSAWKRGPDDGQGEGLCELMGRMCYGSFGEKQGRVGAEAYMQNIMEGGHGSVLEHAMWSFAITRVSRGFTHQMVRHGEGTAFSQESQHFIRYAEEGEARPGGATGAAFCATGIPESEVGAFLVSCKDSLEDYEELWKRLKESMPAVDHLGGARRQSAIRKVVSGMARGLLPNAMESRLGFSANARALRHICQARGTADNTLEIRLVAVQLARTMREEAPAIFGDFTEEVHEDGYPILHSKWKKV